MGKKIWDRIEAFLEFPRNSMVALGIPGTLGICGEFPRNTLANWVVPVPVPQLFRLF